MDLSVDFCGHILKNPILIASCDYSYNLSVFEKTVKSGAAGIVLKSISEIETLHDPRIADFLFLNTDMSPRMQGQPFGGFYSKGGALLDKHKFGKLIEDYQQMAEENDVVLIGSVCSSSLANWCDYARYMEDAGLKIIELNLGNPHYAASKAPMGAKIAQEHAVLYEVINTVASVVSAPLIAKISPQVDSISEVVETAKHAGADAVTISHRFQGMLIDVERRAFWSKTPYGYGGPWMLPIVLAYVSKIVETCDVEICGSGGIFNWNHVLQYIFAGASVVQIATALYLHGPSIIRKIIQGLNDYGRQNGINQLSSLHGCAQGQTSLYESREFKSPPVPTDASVCKACESKPCLDACVFEAIHVNEDGVIEVADSCPACGLCLQFCPLPGALIRP